MTEPNQRPDAWWERALRILPPDRHAAFEEAFHAPRPMWLRVQTSRLSIDQAVAELAPWGVQRWPGVPEALRAPAEARSELLRHALVAAGRVYPQSLSSMLATVTLDPQPGDHVLDLCAAPGSKTGHIGDRLGGTGRLVANELSRNRMFKMRAVLAALGVQAEVRCGDGVQLARRWRDSFDRVLVDAPCSGEGRFHAADPHSWSTWSVKRLKALASKQKALLNAAMESVRPGGVVVYATCTLAPEENEAVVARALKRYPGAVVEPVSIEGALPGLTEWEGKALRPEVEHCVRLPPGPDFDGFFLARLRAP